MATRNYVPRANGEGSIGTEKKHWSAGFFDKMFVTTIEVIGGGAEDDNQPATVGWVKKNFRKMLEGALTAAGLAYNIAPNGYIKLGSMFGGLVIQWGCGDDDIHRFAYPIAFTQEPFVYVTGHNRVIGIKNTSNNYAVEYFSFVCDGGTLEISDRNIRTKFFVFAIGY